MIFGYAAPFESDAALQDYLEGVDYGVRMVCLRCGEAHVALGVHIRNAHGESPRDYRAEYGIPMGIGLVAPGLSGHLRKMARQRLANADYRQRNERLLIEARARLAERHRIGAIDAAPPVPITLDRLRERAASMIGRSRANEEVSTQCPDCGTPVQTTRGALNCWGAIRCADCSRRLNNRRPKSEAARLRALERERLKRQRLTPEEKLEATRRRNERKKMFREKRGPLPIGGPSWRRANPQAVIVMRFMRGRVTLRVLARLHGVSEALVCKIQREALKRYNP